MPTSENATREAKALARQNKEREDIAAAEQQFEAEHAQQAESQLMLQVRSKFMSLPLDS